jgi:5-methylcytosine-specific restriction endonuclease McrA
MTKIKKKSKLQKRKDDHNSRLWRNKADWAWREVCRILHDNKCVICNKSENLNIHHLIPRQMGSHRHIVMNGIALCASCHKYSFELSPHKAPVAFFSWLINNKPDLWKWLANERPTRKPTKSYKDVYEDLARTLDSLKNTNNEENESCADVINPGQTQAQQPGTNQGQGLSDHQSQ